jgi:transcriptional regulator with XRE-family HTH domain
MAQKLGITQGLVSEYELGKLRLHGALIAAFAKVLRATSDEILGLRNIPEDGTTVDRRLARRVKEIQKLSRTDRQALLKTVDAFLEIYGPK